MRPAISIRNAAATQMRSWGIIEIMASHTHTQTLAAHHAGARGFVAARSVTVHARAASCRHKVKECGMNNGVTFPLSFA